MFTGLTKLKHIEIGEWDQIINLDGIFDPSKILKLQTILGKNYEVLKLFANLRSMYLHYFCELNFIPKIEGLTSFAIESIPKIELFE